MNFVQRNRLVTCLTALHNCWRGNTFRETARPAGLATVGVVLVACIAGCGATSVAYINNATVEHSIAADFLTQRQVSTQVSCPAHVPERKGKVFQCTAAFEVGSYSVPVTQVDGKGHVHWSTRAPVVLLDVKVVMASIRRSVLRQRGVRSTVSCPLEVLQREGVDFVCTAAVNSGTRTVKAGTYPFKVTQVDDAGHVTYAAG